LNFDLLETYSAASQTGTMGPIRRAINLILALALTVGCAAAFVYLLFYAAGFRIWMPVMSGVGVFVGLYWIWADYINADPRPEN
jgi:hypothetical protein